MKKLFLLLLAMAGLLLSSCVQNDDSSSEPSVDKSIWDKDNICYENNSDTVSVYKRTAGKSGIIGSFRTETECSLGFSKWTNLTEYTFKSNGYYTERYWGYQRVNNQFKPIDNRREYKYKIYKEDDKFIILRNDYKEKCSFKVSDSFFYWTFIENVSDDE